MASALFNSLIASKEVALPFPKILESTRCTTMKFVPEVKLNEEARNEKKD